MRSSARVLGLVITFASGWMGLLGAGCQSSPKADRIFVGGHVVTMDERFPEIEAVAVGGGRFLAVGTTAQIRKAYPAAEVVDLGGRTVMPGIIEAHGHLLSLGKSLLELNVKGVGEPEEVVERVRKRVEKTPPGEWIVGWGWDEGAWAAHYPSNQALSRAAPDNPVFLTGLHGFAGWANRRALEIAGITADTPDPPRGKILKDAATGEPTGILMNAAQELVTRHIPPLSLEQTERALKLAAEECLRNGLTTVHLAGISARTLEALRSLVRKDELKLRVYALLDASDADLLQPFFENGPEVDSGHRLTVRGIKVFADGALGSRGAALTEPYSDAPQTRGQLTAPKDSLYRITVRALRAGLQVAVHAIGDRANRITLDAYAQALKEVPAAKDPRLRIEHAQVVAPEDVQRFAGLNVIASMQPVHCTSDMGWAEDRLGPRRIRWAYAWRSFLDAGVHLPLSSDYPGETLNPFWGMYAAETRQTPEGDPPGGWYPEQRLKRQEVLRGYTVEAAYAGFEEKMKGRIAPGMLADFIVLSDDIRTVPSRALLKIKVLQTYVGGELVFEAGGGASDPIP